MTTFRRLRFILVLLSAAVALHGQTPLQQPPQFRTSVDLVPLDVRVVDRAGNPITDLRESEFRILENGRPQEIRHFSTVDLSRPDAAQPLIDTRTTSTAIAAPTRRVFLLVLGRGRLQPPGRGADAAIEFVKRHVLPQDYVAVQAWNRATSFSTNHAATVAVLERFRAGHERVEADLKHHFSGLFALYAGPEIPAHIQQRIDTVFTEPGSTPADGFSVLTPGGARDVRRTGDDLLTNELRAGVAAGNFLSSVGQDAESIAARLGADVTFDQYVELNRQSAQDIGNLYAGIAYMRHLAGEKHLVFVTEFGTYLPSADDDRALASQAADARVALHVMHTGGTPATRTVDTVFTSRRVSEETGGTFSSTMRGSQFFDRLNRTTSFQYVLGYSPTNPEFDGRFRRVQVQVTRRGAIVQHRQGYFARRTPPALAPAVVLAQSRIAAAAMSGRAIADLTLTAEAEMPRGTRGPTIVDVTITIDDARVALQAGPDPSLTRVALEVAMFVGDSRERIVGQSWRAVTVDLTAEALERFRTYGLRLTGHITTTAPARSLKVVVYDPAADLLGTATTRVGVPKS